MKIKLLLSIYLFTICFSVFAKQIDENTARTVGQNFLLLKTSSSKSSKSTNFKLVYKSNSEISKTLTTLFYVFNVGVNGFVIVAGDDNITPILGYSTEGYFNPNDLPQNVAKWFEGYKNEIRSIIEQNIKPTTDIKENWKILRKGDTSNSSKNNSNVTSKTLSGVNPLIQTRWNQSPFYNALCPFDTQANQQTVTGCVATAMAQIMKYWNYPASGTGFHSYNHPKYGSLTANYGNTTYQWGSMPNSVNTTNGDVAKLLYDVGVSVDMGYGIASTGGSSAYVISSQSPVTNCSEYALKTYFGYKSTLQGVRRVNYTDDTQWLNLLKTELNSGRPILYAGFGTGGGHCFVADGYDNNNYIHFNWGWAGSYDGYFQISALNPGGVGIGGGAGGFNSGHQALIGIEPPTSAITYNLELNSNVTPSATTIGYGNAFTVTTNISNKGSNPFTGDYAIGVFDSNSHFIDFVETKTNYTLQGGNTYSNNLVFSNTGLFSMVPGTYTLGIYYRPIGGSWKIVQNQGSFVNFTQITVVNPNPVKLNSQMVVSPSSTLTQGQIASVNLNIVNSGTSTFIGQYKVVLYNLDGTFAQDIGTYNEVNGLPVGYTYSSPYLTFTNSITANPGSYIIALQHKTTTGNWELTGSTSTFLNPVNITVIKSPYLADSYEINDTFLQSYNLPLTFSGNNASVKTIGSNAHIGTDNDYYKITLPSGYNYTITPRLQDSFTSNDGNTYTLDALFSYSTDGVTWSEAYDDILSSAININNGGTIYFHVSPYFQGNVGTYLLDVNLSRLAVLGLNNNELPTALNVFPNPTTANVFFDNSTFSFDYVSISNSLGQEVSKIKFSSFLNNQDIDMSKLPSGVYMLKFINQEGEKTIKIIKL